MINPKCVFSAGLLAVPIVLSGSAFAHNGEIRQDLKELRMGRHEIRRDHAETGMIAANCAATGVSFTGMSGTAPVRPK